MTTFDKAAKKAAEKGPTPGQGIPNARIASVRPYRSQAHFDSKGPVAPKDQLYPGSKRLTRNQQAITGQGGTPPA